MSVPAFHYVRQLTSFTLTLSLLSLFLCALSLPHSFFIKSDLAECDVLGVTWVSDGKGLLRRGRGEMTGLYGSGLTTALTGRAFVFSFCLW